MHYEIRITSAGPDCKLAVVRTRALTSELSRVVPRLCGVVWDAIRAEGTKGAGRHVAVYLDCVVNLEVGVEVEESFTGHGEVIGSELPCGPVVTTTHWGPYSGLGNAHRAIRDWCDAHGHRTAGPNWEIYGHWIDGWNNEPSKIRTDVFYLLTTDGNLGG